MGSSVTTDGVPVALQAISAGGWLTLLFMTLGLIASEFSSANLELLGASLGINDSTMGVTFLALGNALPDLFSTFRAIQTGAGNLGIGELLGAAVFLVTVVGGSVMIVRPFRVHPAPFFRDTGVFFLGTLSLLLCMHSGKVTLGSCAWLIVLFFAFVTLVFFTRGYEAAGEMEPLLASSHCVETPVITGHHSLLAAVDLSRLADDVVQNEDVLGRPDAVTDTVDPVSALRRNAEGSSTDSSLQQTEPRRLSAVHVIFHALFPSLCSWTKHSTLGKVICIASTPPVFLLRATVPAPAGISERIENIASMDDHTRNAEMAERRLLAWLHGALTPVFAIWASGIYLSGVPQWALMLAASILGIACRGVLDHTIPRSMVGFIVSALWIFVTVDEVVRVLRLIGDLLGLSDTLLGLTVFTFGNSLGDVVTNIAVARMGHPLMAFSACFASPMVNMLLGIGLSCALVQLGQSAPYEVAFHPSLLLSGYVLLGTLAMYFIVVPTCSYAVGRPLGMVLIGIYMAAIVVAIGFELTNT